MTDNKKNAVTGDNKTQTYWLAAHVYFCRTDDHAVLLDLRRDKYVGVTRTQMRALATRIHGWPSGAASDAESDVVPDGVAAESLLQNMLADGMLTNDPAYGKEVSAPHLPRPETEFAPPELERRPAIRADHALNFVVASLKAKASLRWRSLESVVKSVAVRKHKHSAVVAAPLERQRELVAAFLYLRPLLFTTKDRCLYDSLALVEFLARYGVFPTWLFGVQTTPFGAHSWVQEGAAIYNDTPEYVRRFTPILAI